MLLYRFLLGFGALICGVLSQGSEESLVIVNAIVAKNNISMAECWQLEPGFQLSNVVRSMFELRASTGPHMVITSREQLETRSSNWETSTTP